MEAEQPEEVVVKRYVYSLVSSKAVLDLDEHPKVKSEPLNDSTSSRLHNIEQ